MILRTWILVLVLIVLSLNTSCSSMRAVDPAPEKIFKKN